MLNINFKTYFPNDKILLTIFAYRQYLERFFVRACPCKLMIIARLTIFYSKHLTIHFSDKFQYILKNVSEYAAFKVNCNDFTQ